MNETDLKAAVKIDKYLVNVYNEIEEEKFKRECAEWLRGDILHIAGGCSNEFKAFCKSQVGRVSGNLFAYNTDACSMIIDAFRKHTHETLSVKRSCPSEIYSDEHKFRYRNAGIITEIYGLQQRLKDGVVCSSIVNIEKMFENEDVADLIIQMFAQKVTYCGAFIPTKINVFSKIKPVWEYLANANYEYINSLVRKNVLVDGSTFNLEKEKFAEILMFRKRFDGDEESKGVYYTAYGTKIIEKD